MIFEYIRHTNFQYISYFLFMNPFSYFSQWNAWMKRRGRLRIYFISHLSKSLREYEIIFCCEKQKKNGKLSERGCLLYLRDFDMKNISVTYHGISNFTFRQACFPFIVFISFLYTLFFIFEKTIRFADIAYMILHKKHTENKNPKKTAEVPMRAMI